MRQVQPLQTRALPEGALWSRVVAVGEGWAIAWRDLESVHVERVGPDGAVQARSRLRAPDSTGWPGRLASAPDGSALAISGVLAGEPAIAVLDGATLGTIELLKPRGEIVGLALVDADTLLITEGEAGRLTLYRRPHRFHPVAEVPEAWAERMVRVPEGLFCSVYESGGGLAVRGWPPDTSATSLRLGSTVTGLCAVGDGVLAGAYDGELLIWSAAAQTRLQLPHGIDALTVHRWAGLAIGADDDGVLATTVRDGARGETVRLAGAAYVDGAVVLGDRLLGVSARGWAMWDLSLKCQGS